MAPAQYARPTVLDEALRVLADDPGPGDESWVIVAGATDHYPARVGQAQVESILDVTAIDGLRSVIPVAGGWRIGALTTWTDLVGADLPPMFDGLREAALAVGGLQIQARGTVVGNVCNASPAADGIPNLLALDAQVELASGRGTRSLPIPAFVRGNRLTVRRRDELVTGLYIPEPLEGTNARSAFEKLGSRAYLVISIAMVAAVVEVGSDMSIARARIAVGACSKVALRLPDLEAELVGRPATPGTAQLARAEHVADLTPIDDVRGSGAYRRDAALTLVRRALERVLA